MALRRVCKKSELLDGNSIHIDDPEIVVFNVDGELFAIKDVCTHDEARLSDGELTGETIICPWHGACFSIRTGEALSPPAIEPVETYPVLLREDDIYVET
ncbi:MAG: non-heme iron oxygenase ferredoxin subunit [Verrucomicrobia bacterium]|nr:non-heme iron oxygenase ferredoxin subunit [Verrucomicrobiota bacterium]MBV8376394.1 non-heme iron oxygenase ferredoxin subunit [Verrucomicrobiota bacterium]